MATTDLSTFSLAGKRALVTGASRGIGRALALGLARCGADVAVTARDVTALRDVVAEIEALGRASVAVELDVREVKAIWPVVGRAADALGGLEVAVANAGVENVRPSLDVDETLWDEIVDTNLKGAFFTAQAAARLMDAGGSIVTLCSLTSGVGVPTAVPYTASKSGLLGLTRALATEWAPLGIRVNGIGPGYFRTALTEVFYQDPDWQQTMRAKIPMARFGELDDLVGATVFLASDAARYVTGQLLYVDGGFMASV
jgi:gluconate 5-dehydrogenase